MITKTKIKTILMTEPMIIVIMEVLVTITTVIRAKDGIAWKEKSFEQEIGQVTGTLRKLFCY